MGCVEWHIPLFNDPIPRSRFPLFPLWLPDPGLRLDRIAITDQAITLFLSSAGPTAPCPLCAQPPRHVHSHYTRLAHDLPIQGRSAVLRLTARRFFCRNQDCPRRVFCEPIPHLLTPYARSTTRLTDTHRHIGLALGGGPGSRLAAKLGMPTSPDTVLRRVKQGRPNVDLPPTPRVIGVDDWAMRKGHTHGTIIIDLERSEVLELWPGRDGAELKTWLGQHSEVEVLSRDRWAAFAEAATEAAPQAKQVADRWHLLKNIREALERFLDRYAGKIAAAFVEPARNPTTPTPTPEVVQGVAPLGDPLIASATGPRTEAAANSAPERTATAKQQRRQERYQEVRRRHADGQSLRSIAREMGLAWRVVQRYVRSDRCPDWRPGRTGPSQAAIHQERIDAWLAEGN